MAGKNRLEGKNTVLALKMLKTITNILDENTIPYSLKAGTLLGIIRENRLLPWDNDMDICIVEKDLPKLVKILPQLKKLEYKIKIKEFQTNSKPFKKGNIRILKIRDRKFYFFKGEITLDIFVKYQENGHYFWQAGKKKYSVPQKFHDELIRYTFDEKEYLIPKEYEAYLAFKYGDWKTPVKEWNPFEDDHAIVGNI